MHSSTSNIVPFIEGEPESTETVWTRARPVDQPFRDAQEYQGRAQDIMDGGRPSLSPADAYNTASGDNLET
jgi:hypothetical protein